MARSNSEVIGYPANRPNSKPVLVCRSPMLTDQVSRQVPQEMKQNRVMLVPIGIQLDASLLNQNTAEVFEWFECVAGEIAFHGWSPLVCVFLNHHAQVAWIIPASIPAGVYSSRRVRRLAFRWV